MRVVMGEMNEVRLLEIMNGAAGQCSRVTAAVAYATDANIFFQHCFDNKIFVEYFGLLDEDTAVSIPVLERLLRAGPLAADPRLIKGHFHSKIIWWHGYGAYIGSANLTSAAWYTNVECGVFFTEAEILGTQMQLDLEQQFAYLRSVSSPVTDELVKALKKLGNFERQVDLAKATLRSRFDEATKDVPVHHGLTTSKASGDGSRFSRFTTEWNDTLQLLRGLCMEFQRLNKRPRWVAPDADPTVHFDQFLHAYYYVRIRDEGGEAEGEKSVELVNRAFAAHRHDPAAALREGAAWWASLDEAPYGEDKFIGTTAPMMKTKFSREQLGGWGITDFQEVFFNVNAFRMHARQIRNAKFGLAGDHRESVEKRSDRLAEWLWNQPRTESQKHIRELLEFLIWGSDSQSMAERLWLVTNDPIWCYDHLGESSLGEAIGWARPDVYPPRNNRTNKALRALGHYVRLFSA